jgi:PilZ domain
MSTPIVVLIAAPDFIPALRDRLGDDSKIVTFGDSEPLRALQAILTTRPDVVALERMFAASPRGAALIARVKSDPALNDAEIRVLSHDSSYQRVSPRRVAAQAKKRPARPVRRLDPGTRRAPRFKVKAATHAAVDGSQAQIVDVSTVGAQLIVPGTLGPKREVTVTLGPVRKPLTAPGTIVWARVELSRKGPVSRIGVEFAEPDRSVLDAFIQAHRRA